MWCIIYIWCLFEADESDDECYGIDIFVWEFEGVIVFVVGNNKDVLRVVSRFDAFNERSLVCVEYVWFVPLEEDVGHRHPLTRHDISGAICRVHGVPFHWHEEVCSFEGRDDISFTFMLEHSLLSCESPSHCTVWYERYAFVGVSGREHFGYGSFSFFFIVKYDIILTFVPTGSLYIVATDVCDTFRFHHIPLISEKPICGQIRIYGQYFNKHIASWLRFEVLSFEIAWLNPRCIKEFRLFNTFLSYKGQYFVFYGYFFVHFSLLVKILSSPLQRVK